MPKSRRRQRPSAPVRRKAPVTWQARVLASTTPLLDPECTRHQAELWASALVAEAAEGRAIVRRAARDRWVAEVCRYADRRRTPEAAALVLALATLIPVPITDTSWAREALRDVAWTSTGPLRPRTARRGSDVWGDRTWWFLEYDDHVLVIDTSRAGPLRVRRIVACPPGAAERYDAFVTRVDGVVQASVETDVDAALSVLADVSRLQRDLLLWPAPETDRLGHLLGARTASAVPYQRPCLPHDERHDLVRAFASGVGLAHDLVLSESCEPLFEYAEEHLDADPLRWSPVLVADFLLSWVPSCCEELDVDLLPDLPDLTATWVTWALLRRGLGLPLVLAAADTARCVAADFRQRCVEELDALGYDESELPAAWREVAA